MTTGPEFWGQQRSHALVGFIPRTVQTQSDRSGSLRVSGAPPGLRVAGLEPSESPGSPGAARRVRVGASPGPGRGGYAPRGWVVPPSGPGAPSEPLRAPGGRHPGALQVIPGARSPRRDLRAHAREQRLPVGPDLPRNLLCSGCSGESTRRAPRGEPAGVGTVSPSPRSRAGVRLPARRCRGATATFVAAENFVLGGGGPPGR